MMAMPYVRSFALPGRVGAERAQSRRRAFIRDSNEVASPRPAPTIARSRPTGETPSDGVGQRLPAPCPGERVAGSCVVQYTFPPVEFKDYFLQFQSSFCNARV